MNRCPHCNRPLSVHLEKAEFPGFETIPGGWRRADPATLASHSRLNAAVRAAVEEDEGLYGREANYEKITPVGRLQPVDIITSLLDAGVTFTFAGLGVGGSLWYFEAPYVIWPALGCGFVAAVARYYGLVGLAQSLLQTVESVTRRDLNGDGRIGGGKPEPPPEPPPLRVEVTEHREDGSWRILRAQFGLDPQKLQTFAYAILRGDSFTERTATGCGWTQQEFWTFRDTFIDRGWLSWRNPANRKQGLELHPAGSRVLRGIAHTALPHPAGGSAALGLNGSKQQQAAAENNPAAGNYTFIGD